MTTGAERERALQWLRLKARILAELDELADVVQEGSEYAARFRRKEPDFLAIRGMGDVLHDFYTGLEKIFEAVAEEMEGGLPTGLHWHRALLEDMATDLPGVRPAVLRRSTARALDEYLRFRHLFRNIYGHELRWNRLRHLLYSLPDVARDAFEDLRRFAAFLGELAVRLEGSGPAPGGAGD